MQRLFLLMAILFSILTVGAQTHTALPHGTVFGTKPDTSGMMDAVKLDAFMDTKPRISTTIKGRVVRVTKTKGGWFEISAGKGNIISAHFKTYNVTIPISLAGHTVIIEGVAEKQFIADDLQHLAGDTVSGKKQHTAKTNPKRKLTFEVKGLMVE